MLLFAAVLTLFAQLPTGEPDLGAVIDAARSKAARSKAARGYLPGDDVPGGEPEQAPSTEPLVISRGEGRVPLVIPRKEELIFDVSLDLGVLGSPKVGEVAILSEVAPFHTFSKPSEEAKNLERGSVTAIAVGQYAVYAVRDELSTLILPQDWPHLIYRKTQTGSESRKRELNVGLKDGVPTAAFRSDTHCDKCKSKEHFVSSKLPWRSDYHCKDCKRAEHRRWREFRSKEVAPGALDMLSATMVARAMVAMPDLGPTEQILVLNKLETWKIVLSRGRTAAQTVRAGKFRAVLVELDAQPQEGADEDDKNFSGLFGIHGTISMWFDAETGIPVLIAGSVPAGPLTLEVRIELRSYSGVPAGFGSR